MVLTNMWGNSGSSKPYLGIAGKSKDQPGSYLLHHPPICFIINFHQTWITKVYESGSQ